jgi:curved DNA-binding protein CbpA
MAGPRDHYATLGVAQDAHAADIRRAFLAIAKRTHPDARAAAASVGPTDPAAAADTAAAAFARAKAAYDVLRDPAQRRSYDVSLYGGSDGVGVRSAVPVYHDAPRTQERAAMLRSTYLPRWSARAALHRRLMALVAGMSSRAAWLAVPPIAAVRGERGGGTQKRCVAALS